VHWTSILTELPQKMHRMLKKSHATVKMATTQTTNLMKLCQIGKPTTRRDNRQLPPLNF